ncbi:MAG: DUF3618 domain-containing protein [Dehalococcoidia bacterium]
MAQRSPQEIRRSIEHNRHELTRSVEQLRGKFREVTDWRGQLRRHRGTAVVGAAVAGFVVAGGVAGVGSLLFGRGRD